MTSPREYYRMKNRAMLSPAETRQIVIDRHRAGHQPYDIANRLGMLVGDVRLLLSLEGIDAPPPEPARPVHPMWDYEEDKRRLAIAKRSSKGARETLEMHKRKSAFSPLSTTTLIPAQSTEESLE